MREALIGSDSGQSTGQRSVFFLLLSLMAIAAITWGTYDRWSGPVLNWLDADGANVPEAATMSAERTAEQKMLIEVTQGELAEAVVTGFRSSAFPTGWYRRQRSRARRNLPHAGYLLRSGL